MWSFDIFMNQRTITSDWLGIIIKMLKVLLPYRGCLSIVKRAKLINLGKIIDITDYLSHGNI